MSQENELNKEHTLKLTVSVLFVVAMKWHALFLWLECPTGVLRARCSPSGRSATAAGVLRTAAPHRVLPAAASGAACGSRADGVLRRCSPASGASPSGGECLVRFCASAIFRGTASFTVLHLFGSDVVPSFPASFL